MKQRRKFILFILLLGILSNFIHPIDPCIFTGKWRSQDGRFEIIIPRKPFKIDIEKIIVNNKELKEYSHEFLYGKDAIAPFFFIYSYEENVEKGYWSNEHRLYLVIGSADETDDYNALTGFYEYAKSKDDQYGEMTCHYEIITLYKVK